ncbi:MAG TPA: hypothetical protein VNG89_06405, partial [Vicinamibacterales bacterium]|nr:hypothetical protein [Vicinamibacterales bacterium]
MDDPIVAARPGVVDSQLPGAADVRFDQSPESRHQASNAETAETQRPGHVWPRRSAKASAERLMFNQCLPAHDRAKSLKPSRYVLWKKGRP